ncbi:MAG: hypothetical protein ACYC21_14380 [Eubacteriales bacterium]
MVKSANWQRVLKIWFLVCLTVIVITLPSAATAATTTTPSEMPIPAISGNCYNCHNAANHPISNCQLCHEHGKYEPDSTLEGGHGGLMMGAGSGSTAPVGSCLVCHAYTNECENCHPSYYYGTPTPLIPDPNPRWPANYTHDATRIDNYVGQDYTYQCEMCHIQTEWPDIPGHNPATFGSPGTHLSTTTGCEECHYTALTTEHFQRNGQNGQPLTCYTCHSSVSGAVRQAVKNGDTGCAACHNRVHGTDVLPNTLTGIPADVLFYPGLKWTAPMPLSLWQGEPWVEGDTTGLRTVISNRSALTGDTVWTFYRDGLTSRGWSTTSPVPAVGSTEFKVTFTKGSGLITVWFYGAEYHNGSGSVPTGSRIEIIFNG